MPSGDRVGFGAADVGASGAVEGAVEGSVEGSVEGDWEGVVVGVDGDRVGAAVLGTAVGVGAAETAGLVTTGALVGVLLDPQPASATPAMAASTVGTSSAEALPCLGDERRLPLCFTQHPFPHPRYEFRSETTGGFPALAVPALAYSGWWRQPRD
jgi:hypothetical protein